MEKEKSFFEVMMNSVLWKCTANECCILFYLYCFLLKKGVRNIFFLLRTWISQHWKERREEWGFPAPLLKHLNRAKSIVWNVPPWPSHHVCTWGTSIWKRCLSECWKLQSSAAGHIQSDQIRGLLWLSCSAAAQVSLPAPLRCWSCLCLPSFSCQRPIL